MYPLPEGLLVYRIQLDCQKLLKISILGKLQSEKNTF